MRADEYLVEEIIKLKQENEELKKQLLCLERDNETLSKNCDFSLKRFNELVNKLKEEWNPKIQKSSFDDMEEIYFPAFTVYNGYGKEEKYEYYKNLFILKENNEESEENNNE